MKVLLAGGTGAIGRPLIALLREAGHEVAVLHRSVHSRTALVNAGAMPLQADVLDRTALLTAVEGLRCDAVVSQLTSLRKTPTMHRDMAATNLLRTRGTANLVEVAERVGARRFVTQSMVLGYGYGGLGDRVLTEADPFAAPERGRFGDHLAAMGAAERQVFDASHVEGVALRYGLFYGPGAAGAGLIEGLRRRRLPVIRHGGVLPWVYLDDAATATVAALEHGTPDTAYNIVDNLPVSMSDMFTALAAAVGAPAPRVIPAWVLRALPYARAMMLGGLRVSNARAQRELGWAPQTPTYREGVAETARLHGSAT